MQSLSIFPDESWICMDLVPLSVGGVARNILCPEHVPKIRSFFQAVSYVLKYLKLRFRVVSSPNSNVPRVDSFSWLTLILPYLTSLHSGYPLYDGANAFSHALQSLNQPFTPS
jgi:hypothetical protein